MEQNDLKHTIQCRLVSNLQWFPCLIFLSAKMTDMSLSVCSNYCVLCIWLTFFLFSQDLFSYLSSVTLKSTLARHTHFHLCFSTSTVTWAKLKTMSLYKQRCSIFDLTVLIRELPRMKVSDRNNSKKEHMG